MRATSFGIVVAALAWPAGAQQAAPSGPQQLLEAAVAQEARGDHVAALASWETLEARAGKNRRTVAIARVRKSGVLLALDRTDEAVAAARAGLADLPTTDPTLQQDRYDAHFNLGRIAEGTLDYSSAADSFRSAVAVAPDPVARVTALRGLIATETFLDPDAAVADLARVNALIATVTVDKTARALFLRLDAELALNRRDYAGARKRADEAIALLGGLTDRIDLNDVAARSDYALASMLLGKIDDARRYMALTGAGRLPKGNFDPAAQMKVPDCGGEAGLRPDDAAIVEFSIGEDGAVRSATPIWSAGGGAAALEFARTARGWSFDPDKVKAMPRFFRYRARVELRCSTAFERPSIGEYFDAELAGWLASQHVAAGPAPAGSDAAVLPRLRVQLAASGPDILATIPLLARLIGNSIVPREEKNALARRALAIADANGVTPRARLAIERHIWATSSGRGWDVSSRDALAAVQSPFYRSDASARAGAQLLAADAMHRGSEPAMRLLHAVAEDGDLPANHPLRVGALMRIASIENARGNDAAARAAFAQTGLSASQCALLDAPPKVAHTNVSSGDFPMEALRWGFEGWTQLQYDVGADGKVSNARVLVSYPPFVFSKAGLGVVKNMAYAKTYRPDGGVGCGGITNKVRFQTHL